MKVSKESIHIGSTISGNSIDIFKYGAHGAKAGKEGVYPKRMHGGEITYWILTVFYNFSKNT